jgi:hypothetical protein
MSARKLAAVLVALCATALLIPVTAGAAQTTPASIPVKSFNKSVPVSGKSNNGKAFHGKFTVTRFVTRHGKTFALGNLTGTLGHSSVNRSNVAIPVLAGTSGKARTAAVCPVLHLTLGPLDLNLLGLTVHLNQVVLNIDAVSGPGNLLGNLLCGVANLLNNTPAPLSGLQLSGLLNIVQQLLGNPALLGL